jgi:hypothetical protein
VAVARELDVQFLRMGRDQVAHAAAPLGGGSALCEAAMMLPPLCRASHQAGKATLTWCDLAEPGGANTSSVS